MPGAVMALTDEAAAVRLQSLERGRQARKRSLQSAAQGAKKVVHSHLPERQRSERYMKASTVAVL